MRYSDTIKLPDAFDEARRYVANARDTLQNNAKFDMETGRYEDPKYVRSAGHYLWSAMLIAMEAIFHVKQSKQNKKGDNARVDIDDYKAVISQRDRKLLGLVIDGYNITHLSMGYDGIQSKQTCDDGFRIVNNIIDRCERMKGDEETNQLPQTTTVIQAEPWAEDHVAHFISTRATSKAPKSCRVITTKILNK